MASVQTKASSLGALVLVALMPHSACAQAKDQAPPPAKDVGGHVGVAVPLVTVTDEETTTVDDQFTLATPIGIGVKIGPRLAVDFEVVVANPIDPVGPTSLVVDPGIVYNWGGVATGLRVAFQIGQTANVGLIPLVNVGLVHLDGATWFVEAAFPTFYSEHDLTFNVVAHTGIGF